MKYSCVAFAVLAASLAIVEPASALDTKVFHAAFCEGQAGSRFMQTSLAYLSLDGLPFTCPLVRDRGDSTTSLGSVVLEGLHNSGTSENFWCRLYSQTEDADAGTYVDYQTKSTGIAGRVQLSFSVASSAGTEGSYALQCDIAPGDELYHYQITESSSATD